MRLLPQKLFTAWFYTVFAVFLLLIYPYIYFHINNPDKHARIHRMRSWGCRWVLRLCGLSPRVIGSLPNLDQPCIFVSNHTSFLDIVVGLALIREQVHYIGKAELREIPFFGIFFQHMDIPVLREKWAGRRLAMDQAADDLNKGIHLFFFPEGTTSLRSPKLLDFKKGAFVLSKNNGVPVVPITFADHWRLFHYDFMKWRKPGKNRVVVHEPMWPDTYDTHEAMKNAAQQQIEAGMRFKV